MVNPKKKNRGKSAETKPPSPLSLWLPIATVSLAFVVFGYRFFRLISDYAVNIFFSDQWDFNNAVLFERHSLWEMFTWQHGPCRLGLGMLLERVVEPVFRWNSRTESFLAGGIIASAALCALWLKKELFGSITYFDVIIPLFFLSPLQYETLFVTSDLAHGPLPLLLIVLYCLAWTCRRRSVRYGLILAINFLAIYTGFGLFLGIVTPVALALDYWVNLREAENGRIYLVAALVLSLVSFASFFIRYKSQPAADCFSPQLQFNTDYAWYAALMFAPFFGAQGIDDWPTAVGAIVACALLVALAASCKALLTRGTHWNRNAAIAILVSFCLLFCVTTAYGRLCLGIEYAQSSRYVVYLNVGILGLYFSLLTIPNRIVRNVIVAIFGLSLLGTIASGERLRGSMEMFREMKEGWKNCYMQTGDLARCNQYAKVYPWDPEQTHLQEKLDFLKKNRQNLFSDSK